MSVPAHAHPNKHVTVERYSTNGTPRHACPHTRHGRKVVVSHGESAREEKRAFKRSGRRVGRRRWSNETPPRLPTPPPRCSCNYLNVTPPAITPHHPMSAHHVVLPCLSNVNNKNTTNKLHIIPNGKKITAAIKWKACSHSLTALHTTSTMPHTQYLVQHQCLTYHNGNHHVKQQLSSWLVKKVMGEGWGTGRLLVVGSWERFKLHAAHPCQTTTTPVTPITNPSTKSNPFSTCYILVCFATACHVTTTLLGLAGNHWGRTGVRDSPV